MSTVIEFSEEYYAAQLITDKIMVAILRFQVAHGFVHLHFLFLQLYLQQARDLRILRKLFLKCEGKCNELQRRECLPKITESVATVRNNLLRLSHKLSFNKSTRHLERWLYPSITEWDDFVESLKVTSDAEVHDLVGKVLHAV
jgi:hypothetical protein